MNSTSAILYIKWVVAGIPKGVVAATPTSLKMIIKPIGVKWKRIDSKAQAHCATLIFSTKVMYTSGEQCHKLQISFECLSGKF